MWGVRQGLRMTPCMEAFMKQGERKGIQDRINRELQAKGERVIRSEVGKVTEMRTRSLVKWEGHEKVRGMTT